MLDYLSQWAFIITICCPFLHSVFCILFPCRSSSTIQFRSRCFFWRLRSGINICTAIVIFAQMQSDVVFWKLLSDVIFAYLQINVCGFCSASIRWDLWLFWYSGYAYLSSLENRKQEVRAYLPNSCRNHIKQITDPFKLFHNFLSIFSEDLIRYHPVDSFVLDFPFKS